MDTRSAGVYTYLLVVLFLLGSTTSLELLDLGSDVGLALGVSKLVGSILETLGFPVGSLLCGLESGIFTNGCVSVGVDLLNIVGANAICEVGGELLLESGGALRYVMSTSDKLRTARRLPPRDSPCTQRHVHRRCTS